MKKEIGNYIYFDKASTEDIEFIYKQCEQLVWKFEDSTKVDIPKALVWLKSKIENSLEDYSAIYFNNIKVGYVSVHKEEDMWELDDFYIFEEYYGKGIGTQVLAYLIEKYDRMFLYVFKENVGAISLYKKFGFEVIKEVGSTRLIMERR